MKLLRFRVTQFRSVEDSGWIDVGRIAALIGVNESGKTNLLTPLWKLNPAREGDIQPTSDYPKKLFGTIRAQPGATWFVSAIFDCANIAPQIAAKTAEPEESLRTVQVWRSFAGSYFVRFPDCPGRRSVAPSEVRALLLAARDELEALTALAKEGPVRDGMLSTLAKATEGLGDGDLTVADLERRSCPNAWCRSDAPGRAGPPGQLAIAGKLTTAVSLRVPIVSRVM